VHVIDHPDTRVRMTELHPEVADLDPRLLPLSKQTFDLADIDVVVNTHLHFDHCGGNHLFAGRPIDTTLRWPRKQQAGSFDPEPERRNQSAE
jgi:N-acyl homoserine lactone hydrolase